MRGSDIILLAWDDSPVTPVEPPLGPLDPPRDHDIPVVTVAAISNSSPPTIPGSAGWQREKREGVAETAPGGSQSSTAALDVTGSSRYLYNALAAATGHASNPGQWVSSGYKPGSDASHQAAKWLFNFETVTSSPTLQFRCAIASATGQIGMITVNGHRVQPTAFRWDGSIAAGTPVGVTLTFPDSRPRRIGIWGVNSMEGRWGGCAVEAGYTLTKPSAPTRKVAILGDSYTNGHSGVSCQETWAWDVALGLGADSILQAGIGGTGFLKALTDMPDSIFAGRVNDILAYDPDVLLIAGGRNDTATDLQMAIEGLLADFVNVPEVYVLPTASESAQADVRAAIAAAATAAQVPYLDVAIDSLPKIADGIHPTFAAHRTLAQEVLARI